MNYRSKIWAGIILSVCAGFAQGAQVAETFRINLDPLIDSAVRHRTQFAVNVSRRTDSEAGARWTVLACWKRCLNRAER